MARKTLYSHFLKEFFARIISAPPYNGVDSPSRVNGVGVFPISKDILIFVFHFSGCPMI